LIGVHGLGCLEVRSEKLYNLARRAEFFDRIPCTLHLLINFSLQCFDQSYVLQVFLDALSFAVGQTRSKQLLLQHARSDEQVTKLQALGMLLGIQEWTESFHLRTIFPKNCIEVLPLYMGSAAEVISLNYLLVAVIPV
jgi:hypothetical protein